MRIYGLLGRGISYSLSPVMHNAAFRALGMDAEYRVFDKSESELESFFKDLKKGRVAGCNITIPYKEVALRFIDESSATVRAIGALNTVVGTDGVLKGHNTDYQGFMKALMGQGNGDLGFRPEGKNAFIFGAGGAAKAVIHCLLTQDIKRIVVADIDRVKSERLAQKIDIGKYRNATLAVANDKSQYNDFISNSDLLINATPCGLKKTDPALFDYNYMDRQHNVFDLIYAKSTPLVKEARARGARAVNGLNMLLYQAARAFEYWTGKDAPFEAMRNALIEKI